MFKITDLKLDKLRFDSYFCLNLNKLLKFSRHFPFVIVVCSIHNIVLMKMKEESEKFGLKLNIQRIKIMASGPITSWLLGGEPV